MASSSGCMPPSILRRTNSAFTAVYDNYNSPHATISPGASEETDVSDAVFLVDGNKSLNYSCQLDVFNFRDE